MRLPKHPNIVPFHSIVVDELEGRFVGFTSVYIPGGTLEENNTRTFKLKWLHQLINVIDELNLNLGISHQDIAPRNLVIHEPTDSLMLFDFDFSARIGRTGYSEARDDVKGTLFTMYEIITRNDNLRAIRHEDQDVSLIEHKEWVRHPDVQLDRPISEFRCVLEEWCEAASREANYFEHRGPQFLGLAAVSRSTAFRSRSSLRRRNCQGDEKVV